MSVLFIYLFISLFGGQTIYLKVGAREDDILIIMNDGVNIKKGFKERTGCCNL